MRGARVNNVLVEKKIDNREICGGLGRHVVILAYAESCGILGIFFIFFSPRTWAIITSK